MSYWSHHPELLEEVTTDFMPEPWKSQVENGDVDFCDVPDDIKFKAMKEGTEDYWAIMADHAYDMKKEERLR